MTQDELRAALLLMGFSTGAKKLYWYKYETNRVITITFKKYDVCVYYRTPPDVSTIPEEFSSSPQTAFDFLKEKLT